MGDGGYGGSNPRSNPTRSRPSCQFSSSYGSEALCRSRNLIQRLFAGFLPSNPYEPWGTTHLFYMSEPPPKSYTPNTQNTRRFMCIILWVFPKIMVPPNHPFVHRVFHYFHHPFWGPTPVFGNTRIILDDLKVISNLDSLLS